jgi:exo-beta-1,3-glucanase (GH17 family)
MNHLLFIMMSMMLLSHSYPAAARKTAKTSRPDVLQCAAFSPYVGTLNPNYGAHPSKALIAGLLDNLVKQTPYRCIMTYGVLNGLDAIFTEAKARQIKVIAIIWLDNDPAVNTLSIAKGIEVAKAFPETIVKLSCGSEVRTRHGHAFDGEISRCIEGVRAAGVKQPITTIDTWWEWCNRSLTCATSSFAAQVDWLGTNIFPWWENKFSGAHTCTPADKAADFHLARLAELHRVYPDKEIIMTEFGWPNAPDGGTENNIKTGQHCGIASHKNQALVVQSTFKKLAQKQWSGVVFEAFSENWKASKEGDFGNFWGICEGQPPYHCSQGLVTR